MVETVVVIWIAVMILVVLTLFAGVKTVPQGQIWTVERFGAYTRMLQPGLQFVLPYVDRIGRRLNVQEQVVEIPEQSVITRDNATVAVDGIIYFRVMEPEKAAYQVQNLQVALTTLATTNIRAVIGELELDATLSSRERINSSLLEILDGATLPWGVKVSRVEIRKIEPPQNLIQAMNMQMTAERERRATVARADGEREAAVKRAEGEKQALILAAEGRQQAASRDAEARIALANAEAEATRLVSQAASAHGSDGLRYFVASAYVKAFEAMAASPNSRLVVVPMEASAIAGGIAQAIEFLRGPPNPPPASRPPPRPTGWVVGGLALLGLELLVPGVYLTWIGLGALGTGAAVWGVDLEFGGQVAVFAVLSVASVVIGLRLRKPSGRLNTQTAGLAGRAATALVFDGREGRVRLGDSDWPARVPHGVAAPATGTRLRVEGVDGSVLIVRPESV